MNLGLQIVTYMAALCIGAVVMIVIAHVLEWLDARREKGNHQ